MCIRKKKGRMTKGQEVGGNLLFDLTFPLGDKNLFLSQEQRGNVYKPYTLIVFTVGLGFSPTGTQLHNYSIIYRLPYLTLKKLTLEAIWH